MELPIGNLPVTVEDLHDPVLARELQLLDTLLFDFFFGSQMRLVLIPCELALELLVLFVMVLEIGVLFDERLDHLLFMLLHAANPPEEFRGRSFVSDRLRGVNFGAFRNTWKIKVLARIQDSIGGANVKRFEFGKVHRWMPGEIAFAQSSKHRCGGLGAGNQVQGGLEGKDAIGIAVESSSGGEVYLSRPAVELVHGRDLGAPLAMDRFAAALENRGIDLVALRVEQREEAALPPIGDRGREYGEGWDSRDRYSRCEGETLGGCQAGAEAREGAGADGHSDGVEIAWRNGALAENLGHQTGKDASHVAAASKAPFSANASAARNRGARNAGGSFDGENGQTAQPSPRMIRAMSL
jgi:hypothetical protein